MHKLKATHWARNLSTLLIDISIGCWQSLMWFPSSNTKNITMHYTSNPLLNANRKNTTGDQIREDENTAMLNARTNLCFSPINTYFKCSGASNKEYEKKGGQNRSAYNWIWGIFLLAHDPWDTSLKTDCHVRRPCRISSTGSTKLILHWPIFILFLPPT